MEDKHPFDDFKFSIDFTRENEVYLKAKGYEKRNGSCAYIRTVLMVVPFKKWYWEDTYKSQIHLTIETETIVKTRLVIKN